MKPTPINGLSRAERLRGRSAVSQLFTSGESGFAYPVRYLWRKREGDLKDGEALISVLFTVPKRSHKKANKRNKLRRQVKEAYRLQKHELLCCGVALDLALIFTAKDIVDYDKITRSVKKILGQIKAAIEQDEQKQGDDEQ